MYALTVKDHIMIAHSLPDPFFGPAQGVHGATFHVEASIMSEQLNDKNVVMDIGEASAKLRDVLAPLSYQNLDELEPFRGQLTTTEYLARYIHDQMSQKLKRNTRLRITLHESDRASASYEQ